MWCPGEQAFLADENLLDFILKDDVPCPEILREENTVLENSDLSELEVPDKDIDDFINSLLNSFEDKPGMLQDYLLSTSDSSISEYQHTSPSLGSAFVRGLQTSDIVQFDHNYSLHQDCLEMENMRSERAEGHVFTDLGMGMDLEDGSKALELNFFPVAVDANPQLVPGATVQPDFPGLSEEVRQLLLKEGTSLPACQPLMNVNPHCSLSLPSGPGPMECFSQSRASKIQEGALAEGRPVKTVLRRRKSQNKQAAQESRRKKSYVEDLEHRMAACMAQNHRLEKKVEVLQKRNMSLFKQVQRLQALMGQSKAETAPAESCSTVMVLSLYFVLSPSAPLSEGQKTQVKIRVVSRKIRQLPNQAAPEEQEAMVEGYSLEPHNLLQLGSLNEP